MQKSKQYIRWEGINECKFSNMLLLMGIIKILIYIRLK